MSTIHPIRTLTHHHFDQPHLRAELDATLLILGTLKLKVAGAVNAAGDRSNTGGRLCLVRDCSRLATCSRLSTGVTRKDRSITVVLAISTCAHSQLLLASHAKYHTLRHVGQPTCLQPLGVHQAEPGRPEHADPCQPTQQQQQHIHSRNHSIDHDVATVVQPRQQCKVHASPAGNHASCPPMFCTLVS